MRTFTRIAGAAAVAALLGFGAANAAQPANMSMAPNAPAAGVQLVADGCGRHERRVCVDWHRRGMCGREEYRERHAVQCCERWRCVRMDGDRR